MGDNPTEIFHISHFCSALHYFNIVKKAVKGSNWLQSPACNLILKNSVAEINLWDVVVWRDNHLLNCSVNIYYSCPVQRCTLVWRIEDYQQFYCLHQSQSQKYIATGGLPPISLSWCQAPWGPWPEIFFSTELLQ
jgi:hypothetical protein